MSDQSNIHLEPELQLVVVSTETHDKEDNMPVDLITEYRVLEKKCNEALRRIYNRKAKQS